MHEIIFTTSYFLADTSSPVADITTGMLLREAAAEAADRVALVEAVPPAAPVLSGAARTDRTWTYAQLLAEAETCAHWLLTRFSPGERIVHVSANRRCGGCWRAGPGMGRAGGRRAAA